MIATIHPSHALIPGIDHCPEVPGLEDPDRADGALDMHLVNSIGLYGVQVPIVLALVDGHHVVVDGRQRVMAARECVRLGLTGIQLPYVLHDPSTSGASPEVSMVLANEGRRVDGPMAKARKAAKLAAMGYDIADIATAMHVSRASAHNYLGLVHDLIPEAQAMVDSGRLPAATAYTLAKKSEDHQRKAIQAFREDPDAARGDRGVDAARDPSKKARVGLGRREIRDIVERLGPPAEVASAVDDRSDDDRLVYGVLSVVLGDHGVGILADWPEIQDVIRQAMADRQA